MLNHVKKEIENLLKEDKIQDKFSVQLAYSGGIDSSCLLDVLIKLRSVFNFDIYLTYLNYKTSNYSSDVADYVEKTPSDIKSFTKERKILKKYNFESKARDVRYSFLSKISVQNKINYTFTAHHKNDQMETLIMKFIDGGDFISMQGIRKRMGNIFRPILEIEKDEIIRYAKKNSVIYFEDPSNENFAFIRNKIRKILVSKIVSDPFLFKKINTLNGESSIKLLKAREKINKEMETLIIENSYNPNFLCLDLDNLKSYDILFFKLLMKSVLKKRFSKKAFNKNKNFWYEFFNFINNAKVGSSFALDDTIKSLKDRNVIFLFNAKIIQKNNKRLRIKKKEKWSLGTISVLDIRKMDKANNHRYSISEKDFDKGLFVRHWKYGDKVSFEGMSKKVSDLFIDAKLPLLKKKLYPIIEDSNKEIVWIPGLFSKKNNKITSSFLLEWKE